jgi:hypothetical protein
VFVFKFFTTSFLAPVCGLSPADLTGIFRGCGCGCGCGCTGDEPFVRSTTWLPFVAGEREVKLYMPKGGGVAGGGAKESGLRRFPHADEFAFRLGEFCENSFFF